MTLITFVHFYSLLIIAAVNVISAGPHRPAKMTYSSGNLKHRFVVSVCDCTVLHTLLDVAHSFISLIETDEDVTDPERRQRYAALRSAVLTSFPQESVY